MKDFIQRLDQFIQEDKSDALFALVIEEISDGKNFVRYRLASHCGNKINKKHWVNFGKELSDGRIRPFFKDIIHAKPELPDISVWQACYLAPFYTYTGELDSLVKVSTDITCPIIEAFWLSAIALKSDEADQPNRLIIIASPSYGTQANPRAGRSAGQEWRMLHLLRVAYKQLDHQISHLGKRITAQREPLIRSLGSGLLAHELHTQLIDINLSITKMDFRDLNTIGF